MQMGYAPEEWKDRPLIAVLNTWSDAQPCHMHFKARVDDVKRGILMAGGFPVELPALSLSESLLKPTTMLYRNLLAMDAEELLRGHPVDGVVLMGGCDKTTPALLVEAWMPVTCWAISCVALAVCSASDFTSWATTANPRPASP